MTNQIAIPACHMRSIQVSNRKHDRRPSSLSLTACSSFQTLASKDSQGMHASMPSPHSPSLWGTHTPPSLGCSHSSLSSSSGVMLVNGVQKEKTWESKTTLQKNLNSKMIQNRSLYFVLNRKLQHPCMEPGWGTQNSCYSLGSLLLFSQPGRTPKENW